MANSSPSNPLGNNGGRLYSYAVRPVLIDCNFVVDSTNGNGLGIRSLKGSGVEDVFMYTAETAGAGNSGLINPLAHTASEGLILVKLKNNYARYLGGFSGFVAPTTGGTLAINSTALTVGSPYIIASSGHGPAGSATISPVADSSGSLSGHYFNLFDGYGNVFILWYYVTGVAAGASGSAPQGLNGTPVQVTIAENATAANITTALSGVIANLPAGPASTQSFTTSGGGGATLTVTSTNTNPYGPIAIPQDGLAPLATGATMALVNYSTNGDDWRGVGLPSGVDPNVGASFVATASGYTTGGGSTGLVIAPGGSGISSIEVIGDPNQSLAPKPRGMGRSPNVGGYILLQCMAPVTSTTAPTQPANGSVVGLSFSVELSSVLIAGE